MRFDHKKNIDKYRVSHLLHKYKKKYKNSWSEMQAYFPQEMFADLAQEGG